MFRDYTFKDRYWGLYLTVLILGVVLFFILIFCNRCCSTINNVTTNIESYELEQDDDVEIIQDEPLELRDDISNELDDRISNEGSDYGALTFSLIWNTTDDLDLLVRQPNGNDICYLKTKKQNKIGGQVYRKDETTNGELDIDYNAPGTLLSNSPVEHIIIQDPGLGKYIVRVSCYQRNSNEQFIKYKLIQKNSEGEEKYWEGELSQEKSGNNYRTHYGLN